MSEWPRSVSPRMEPISPMRSRAESHCRRNLRKLAAIGTTTSGATTRTASASRKFSENTYTRTRSIVRIPWTKSAMREPKAVWICSASARSRVIRSPLERSEEKRVDWPRSEA